MIVGDPPSFDVAAVEKDSQPLAAFGDRYPHVGSSNSLARSVLVEHPGRLEAVMQITRAAADDRDPPFGVTTAGVEAAD
jgi:hypothetical protein